MMQNNPDRAVSGMPAGLIACRLGGEQLHIVKIAPDALWLRLSELFVPQGRLEMCFHHLDGSRRIVCIEQYCAGEARRDDCGALVRLSFENKDYQANFHRAMSDYAAYIRAFSDGMPGDMVGYPYEADENFEDPSDCDFSYLHFPENREICISLRQPADYALYLDHSLPVFLEKYAADHRLSKIIRPDRLYVSNGFCRQLFPDDETLRAIIRRAGEDALALTLVTAPDPRLSEAILQCWNGEMLVNDWGLLYRLQAYPQIQPILGTLLNKRRKDPRLCYVPALEKEMLSQNAVNSYTYRQFLQKYRVNRWEFERCGYDFDLPEGSCSLHLPFYQTNTSVFCPLRALCEHGDRGFQNDDAACPRYCENNGLLYPAHLKLLWRWNSLFALDDRPLDDLPGFDRIVLNF